MRPRRFFFVATMLLAVAANAQEFRATLNGRVTDPQDLAVVGATVQARNVSTNEASSATTDSHGNFSIPFLRPGDYTVNVQHPGFKQYTRQAITLEVAQTASITIQLQLGATSEVVSVTAEAPLLETDTADRGGVVDSQRVAELPLNARNPFMLGAMMSGVTFRGSAIWQRPFDNGAIAEWSINGSRQHQNEFLMDGAPNNAQAGTNNVAYVPIVDAVQEFKMQSNTYDAQYGHTSGGIMNVVLKSGGNQLHGAGWEFMRRKWLDANTFQNKATCVTNDPCVTAPRTNHYLDQYGVQLQGPVFLPRLYDGHDKTFFLFSFENYREGTPNPLTLSVPEPQFLNGDFSKLTDGKKKLIPIYNPFSTDPSNRTRFQCDPTTGNPLPADPVTGRQATGADCNKIPSSMLNPIAQKILGYFPKPNQPAPTDFGYSQRNLYLPAYFAKDKFYNFIARIDQVFNQKHRVFIRYAQNIRTEDRNSNGINSGFGQDGQQPFQRLNWTTAIDYVAAFSPTFVGNVRVSFNRFIERGFGAGDLGFDLTTLGFPAATINQLPKGDTFFGRYEFEGYTSLGRYRSINITNNYAINPNVTKIWKSHSIHTGVDIRRIQYILNSTGDIWQLRGNKDYTRKVYNKGDDGSGNGIASFLLGVPSGGTSSYPLFPFFRQWYYAPFVQDDWKVSNRLSVNLGLRWDFNLAPDEKYNRLAYQFDPNAQPDLARFPELGNCPGPTGPIVCKGGLTFTGVGGNPTKTASTNYGNIQARIGVAYQLTRRLVVRGGWGRYFSNPGNEWQKTTGFSTSTPLVSSTDGGRTPIPNVLSNPFPNGILAPSGSSSGPATFVGRNFSWFDPTFKTPSVDQFSLGFQIGLSGSSMLEISYVGSRGHSLQSERDYNLPSLAFRRLCNPLEGGKPSYCNELLDNPFYNKPAFLGTDFYTNKQLSRFQLARPFPQFSGNLTRQGLNEAATWYNSLQVNYNMRWGKSLNLLADYTFSKLMERWGYTDTYQGIIQQSPYFNDRPHAFKLATVYQLPFGRGRWLGSNANKFVDTIIGGWQWSTFLTAQSGEPADLPGNVHVLRDPRLKPDWHSSKVYGFRPCVYKYVDENNLAKGFQPAGKSLDYGCGGPPQSLRESDYSSTYNFFLLPSYAPRETPFRSGQIRMYGTFTMDASLNKAVVLSERFKLQARAEAFNLLNHYAFPLARFNTNPTDTNGNFGALLPGTISTVDSGFPRQFQLGIKLLW